MALAPGVRAFRVPSSIDKSKLRDTIDGDKTGGLYGVEETHNGLV